MPDIVDQKRIALPMPNWATFFCFKIDHGQICGVHFQTIHNCFYCRSLVLINGVPSKLWQIINPFKDIAEFKVGESVVTFAYRFFPSVKVTISVDGGSPVANEYPDQSKRLCLVCAIMLIPVLLATILFAAILAH